jgi:hypothetical protein
MIVAASLALAMGVLVAPGSALAQRAQGFHDSGLVAGGTTLGVSRSVVVPLSEPFVSGPVVGGATLGTSRSVAVPFPRDLFASRPFIRPFFPFAFVVAAPPVVYAAPPPYYPPPIDYPPADYDPSASYSPPVSYAPTPSVVQFENGRYELRGDGVTTPYIWVWVPNPPTVPPPTGPPPPSTPPAVGEPTSGGPSAPRMSQLYRWIDEQGVVHWTNRLDRVPEQYRSRAKQTTPS